MFCRIITFEEVILLIKDKYDLLKYLFAHMSTDTHRYRSEGSKLTQMIGGNKESQYISELRDEGFIDVYIGEIFLRDKAIDFLINL